VPPPVPEGDRRRGPHLREVKGDTHHVDRSAAWSRAEGVAVE
jgi:hypothetical protein